MLRPAVALLSLAVVASTALAQGSGRERPRRTDADYGKMLRESPIALRLTNGDVEDMDPVKRLVDKRKDLKLTDEQQKQLRDIDAKLRETNKPNFKTLDSLRQAMRPRAGADEDMERARTSLAREAVLNLVTVIRGTYDAGLKEALPILDATQQPKADELLKKQAEETDETLKEKLGGGMSGGRGRRGGGA